MNTAMFGGSFDPVHNGHVQLAQAFIKELSLDKVFIVPAFISPFKQGGAAVLPHHRAEMCRLAFSNIPQAEISDIEIKREGSSYTYQTLQALTDKLDTDKIFLITGADSFMSIHKWKEPEIIFRHAVICGLPRNDDDISALEKQSEYLHGLGAETRILNISVMTVSSTDIRCKAAKGESIRGLVPDDVERYIIENGLYFQK